MLELEGRYKARGLRVIGVSRVEDVAKDNAEVAKTATEHKMVYPSFLDVDDAWTKQAGINKAPSFVVLDKQGRVVASHKGRLMSGSDEYKRLAAAVEKTL